MEKSSSASIWWPSRHRTQVGGPPSGRGLQLFFEPSGATELCLQGSLLPLAKTTRTALPCLPIGQFCTCSAQRHPAINNPLFAAFRLKITIAMASPHSAKEALQAWLKTLSPEDRLKAQKFADDLPMGASLPASTEASGDLPQTGTTASSTSASNQADPSTTPIPEELNPVLVAQQEWYAGQDKVFQGTVPPEMPWQDDDLSAQPSSSTGSQPMPSAPSAKPQVPDAEPWLLPTPDTRLFNIFGEAIRLQDVRENIAKGQQPDCLYRDVSAPDDQPLNRQELWAAVQFKPIYRTAGRWTNFELLPADIRTPPPQFCIEVEDAPKLPPAHRLQPKEKARRCLRPRAPACHPNRLGKLCGPTRPRRDRGRRQRPEQQPPHRLSQPRQPQKLRRLRPLSTSPTRRPRALNQSLHHSSTCAHPNHSHSCLKRPSLKQRPSGLSLSAYLRPRP